MLHLFKKVCFRALGFCFYFLAQGVKNPSCLVQLFSIGLGYAELGHIFYLDNSTDLLSMLLLLQLQPLNFQRPGLSISFQLKRNILKCRVLRVKQSFNAFLPFQVKQIQKPLFSPIWLIGKNQMSGKKKASLCHLQPCV